MIPRTVEGPAEIHCGRASGEQGGVGRGQTCVRGIGAQREPHSVSSGGADERRAAHEHGADGVGRLGKRGEAERLKFVRQFCLIDDLDGGAVIAGPDRAPMFAEYVHRVGGLE